MEDLDRSLELSMRLNMVHLKGEGGEICVCVCVCVCVCEREREREEREVTQ